MMNNGFQNVRPGRGTIMLGLRAAANRLRSFLFFNLKAPWVKRSGMTRIPWGTVMWSPHRDVKMGHHIQFGHGCVVECDVEFGNYVMVARGVAFVGRDDHRIDVLGREIWNSGRGDTHKTFVGNDVWICHNSTIIAGIRIGDGAIVAAGSVVVKDVEPYSIVGGNPARFIRARFEPEQLAKHLKLMADKQQISNNL
ncbi:MAG: CatB-related O-acetyltransferase [Victivallaceae bacterium]|nr:CatB-related O-acetyltransferase [Victivallaceae bacterium]